MATGRIAVHMAAPNTSRDDRDALTEFVNVIAFDERCRHLLMNCSTGQLVAVGGGVTLDFYKSPRRHPKDQPDDHRSQLKDRIGAAAADALPEEADQPYGEPPNLD